MIRRLNSLYALLPLTVVLGACTTDSDESVDPVTDPNPGFVAVFKPDLALMPFPTDVWRNGSTDGTLNIVEFESDPLLLHIEQMNLLDGYGLNSQVWANFNEPVDETTLVLGQTVFVFDVTNPLAPAPVMTFDVGTAGFQGGRAVVELNPTQPLQPLHTYAVYLTAGIESEGGANATADASFQAMIDAYNGGGAADLSGNATLQGIYAAMVESLLTLADGAGIGADNVVAAWTFTTQSISNSLDVIADNAEAQRSAFVPLLRDPANPGAGIRTAGELMMPSSDTNDDGTPDVGLNADVYAGAIEMPYYSDPSNPLTGYWEADAAAPACAGAIAAGAVDAASASTTVYCATPVEQATVSVPVLLTIPNAASGCGAIAGVVIFQHGITQARTNVLPVADSLAQACHAAIAIDLPLHGITDTASALYASAENQLYASLEAMAGGITDTLTEQTFDLDVDGTAGIDPSGEYFINLESPITARDALRQAAANLIHLSVTIPVIDYNAALGAVGPDFAALPIHFVGHSLGGITGATYLGVDATADAAVLVAPGGDIADLLLGSASIRPEVDAGLAENGLVPGMRFYDEFFRNAQTIVDAGDPINYAAAANAGHDILMMEIVGGAGNLPDQVVPNSATEALADAMGLPVVTSDVAGLNVDGSVQFSVGGHGSLLRPDPSAAEMAATVEMQKQMATFIGSGGNFIDITDTSVIAP